MSASLYTNYQGRPITTHSYSSGSDFKTCKRFFYLRRIAGYRDRDQRGSLEFGKSIEAAVQYFYENNQRPGSGVDELKRLWLQWKDIPLVFTAKEGSWADLYKMGSQMLALFEILAPTLPISRPVFQARYAKEIFPGSHLAGIEVVGYADIVSQDDKGLSTLDVKTAANAYDLPPALVAMDPQLATYAWLSGISRTGFLVFVKARPNSYESGDKASLLVASGNWTAGALGTVFPLPKDKPKKGEDAPVETGPVEITLLPPERYAEFKEKAKDVRGKALEEMKRTWAAEHAITVPVEHVTKQRIQLLTAEIPAEAIKETGERIGRQIADIAQAAKDEYWPREPSVRFPDQKCVWCSMRGPCTGDQALTERKLVQIGAAPERDWLDELDEA